MNIAQHDLWYELPEYQEAIQRLKAGNPHFASLFAEYRRLKREVQRAEENDQPLSDVAFENLKKQRLRLKDELFAMLLAKS